MGEKLRSSCDSTGEFLGKQTHCMCVCMFVYVCVCTCDMREWFFFLLSTYSCSEFRGCQSSQSASMTTEISTPSSEEGKLLVMCCLLLFVVFVVSSSIHCLSLHIRESRIGTSEATFDPPVALHVYSCCVGPETARKRLAVSSNVFAYWLIHTITFERKV